MKMKRLINITCLLTGLMILATACSVQRSSLAKKGEVTILGLGDSITEGGPEFFSYLFPLDSMLRRGGYKVKFIGPRSTGQRSDSIRHSGFSGKTAEFLAKNIDSIYTAFPADIVLLHSGHNHFVEEAPIDGIIRAQRSIIKTIKAKNRDAHVFVAAVITAGKLPKYEYIPALNAAIRNMVGSMNDPSVIFVDQQQGWDWNLYTIQDKVHPNRAGANRIAKNWYDAITPLLKKQQ